VYPGKMFIAWLKDVDDVLLHMKSIHMKTNEDGKNVDQEVGEGSL
jgi:hypothetical protein